MEKKKKTTGKPYGPENKFKRALAPRFPWCIGNLKSERETNVSIESWYHQATTYIPSGSFLPRVKPR